MKRGGEERPARAPLLPPPRSLPHLFSTLQHGATTEATLAAHQDAALGPRAADHRARAKRLGAEAAAQACYRPGALAKEVQEVTRTRGGS